MSMMPSPEIHARYAAVREEIESAEADWAREVKTQTGYDQAYARGRRDQADADGAAFDEATRPSPARHDVHQWAGEDPDFCVVCDVPWSDADLTCAPPAGRAICTELNVGGIQCMSDAGHTDPHWAPNDGGGSLRWETVDWAAEQAELDELERTDPDVAAAAASYDRMVEKVTGSQIVRRLVVELNQRSDDDVNRAAIAEKTTRTTVINRAIQVYEMVRANQAAGGHIIRVNPDGTREKVTFS